MRLIFIFSSFLFSVFLLSCGSDNSPSPQSGASNTAKFYESDILEKRVVLLVDVSSSITEDSKKLAAQYARQIASDIEDDSHLLVYTTERSTTQQAIIDVKKIMPLAPLAKAEFNAKWPAKVKRVSEIVYENCQKGMSSSCILDGLKSVRTGLNGVSKAQETYLLVISDMLECCELGCPKIAKDFVEMKKELEKRGDLNAFELASLIPQDHIKICFINENVKSANADMIASPQFREFWQQAFKMLGYSGMPQPGTSIGAFLELIKG